MIRPETKVWTSKYLNNIIEQDHKRVKQRVYPTHWRSRMHLHAICTGTFESIVEGLEV